MRLFIAIKVYPTEMLLNMLNELKKYGKTVESENIHLTLKFLGEVENESKIIGELEKVQAGKFTMKLKGIGAFPNERRARVIFVTAGPEKSLANLSEQVDNFTSAIKRDHPFAPHVTVLRAKQPLDIKGLMESNKEKEFGTQEINYFSLFKSTLTPNGPIYEELKKFQLM